MIERNQILAEKPQKDLKAFKVSLKPITGRPTAHLMVICVLVMGLIEMTSECLIYDLSGVMTTTCPDGTFGNWDNCVCEPCHEWCSTCTNGSLDGCTTCKEGGSPFYPSSYIGKFCTGCATIGEYRDLDTNTCHPCHSSCLTCHGPNFDQCRTCQTNFQLCFYGSCAQKCTETIGFYFDSYGYGGGLVLADHVADQTGYVGCKACHPSCRTC
jgi:proprotein convertase subtilisin/kexin type 5